jgi:hypothetical protein
MRHCQVGEVDEIDVKGVMPGFNFARHRDAGCCNA